MAQEVSKENVRFAIESKDESEGTIVVIFWMDGQNFTSRCNIQLPIDPETSSIPSGQALTDLIMLHAPVQYFIDQLKRYKASVMVDYSEIDRLIAEGKEKIPKLM